MNTSKITIKVPAEKTFDLPVGVFPGVLVNVKPLTKQTKKGPQNWIRLVFELDIAEFDECVPCAGRNFLLNLNAGSDLRNFLEAWLGDNLFAGRSNQEFDFGALLNQKGNVCLSHWHSEKYSKPHVRIDWVHSVKPIVKEVKP